MRAMTCQVNPEGVEHRESNDQIQSREFHTTRITSTMWHMDQNEKLMKHGGMIIFGIVDGATKHSQHDGFRS